MRPARRRFSSTANEAAKAEVAGSLANWIGDFRLLLANERTGDRPWHGELHLVAIYDRALSAGEVAQNFKAGSNWSAVNLAALLPPAADRKIDFVKDVQPILRKHCFECHAEGNEEGGLNLGVKSRALEGGDHGPVFAAGQSAASRLIHLVAGVEKDNAHAARGQATADQGRNRHPAGLDRPGRRVAGRKPTCLDPRLEQARTHWAFQPLRSVEPPAVKDEGWVRTPIDRFILAALEAKGLAPSPRAESRTLLAPAVVRRDRPAAVARALWLGVARGGVRARPSGRRRMKRLSTSSSPAGITASAGAGTGSTSPAMPTATATRATPTGRTPISIATS